MWQEQNADVALAFQGAGQRFRGAVRRDDAARRELTGNPVRHGLGSCVWSVAVAMPRCGLLLVSTPCQMCHCVPAARTRVQPLGVARPVPAVWLGL